VTTGSIFVFMIEYYNNHNHITVDKVWKLGMVYKFVIKIFLYLWLVWY
jgi:hypothetical protein